MTTTNRRLTQRDGDTGVANATRRRLLVASLLSAVAPGVLADAPNELQPAAVSDRYRIATPDRVGTETLLALGVAPVAAGARSIYTAMGGTPPLPENVADIGYWFEPNLEVMRALQVDLIVIEAMSLNLKDVLERVAPIVVMEIYTGAGHPDFVERSSAEMFRLARSIGREEAARRYRGALDARLAAIRDELREPGRRPAFVAQLDPSGQSVFLYAKNCVTWDVMQRVGFDNAWRGATNTYGCAQVGIDQLASAPDADLFYIDYGAPAQAALTQLAQSPVWKSLPMVRERRVYPLAPFDPLGALPTAIQFAENFRAAVVAKGRG